MTREEELDWLCRLRSEIYVYMPKEWLIPMNNALDMAIKALEQEPCEDCISRAETLEKFRPKGIADELWKECHEYKVIASMPSVQPKTKWIPLRWDIEGISCDIPWELDGKWLLFTNGKYVSIERIKKDAQDHFWPEGQIFELEDAIAWMPLPKPYKKKRGNEDV